jgi:ACR3 family arsenite transporter
MDGVAASMSLFERWLTLWVFLCIIAGVALGQWFPAPFQALGRMEVAQVNLPVGLLIEVPVMLLVVKLVNRSRGWYERDSIMG